MARPFTATDAKRTIEFFTDLQSKLSSAIDFESTQKDELIKCVNRYVFNKQSEILKSIPIENIAQEKRGVRYNALKEANFKTYNDVYSAKIWQLASVYGISENTAYEIKRIVSQRAETATETVKIKLSIDDINVDSTAIVSAAAAIINCDSFFKKCHQLVEFDKLGIQFALEDLEKGKSRFKWLFLSKQKKERAEKAYQKIFELVNGIYGKEVQDAIDGITQYSKVDSSDAWNQFSSNSVKFYNIIESLTPGVLGNGDVHYGLPEDLAKKIEEECLFPEGLLCTLRRYQELGVKYILHQERVLLGDEMGLGKTVQAIAVMVSLRNTGATHFMVVCPASVLSNWCKEIIKHSKLSAIRVHGADKIRAFDEWKRQGGVAVTTYETTGSLNLADDEKFSLLVVDEAHYIKNSQARRTKNTIDFSRHADRLLFMTGTALENHVDEMIQLLRVLQPKIASEANNYAFMAGAPQFREIVAPVYYRRKREDVLTELPELIEKEEWVDLLQEEEQIYENSVYNRRFNDMRRVSWNIENLDKSSKAIRMKEIIEEAKEDKRKVIVFSFFLDTTRKIQQWLGSSCGEIINGSVSPKHRQEIIDSFENAPSGSVLISQIQAGGTGLNIQSASVVIICEPQLKPSIENQAISRAYRMGQTRNVLVYRLLCDDTIDERMIDRLALKQAEFDAFADDSVAASTQKELELDNKSQNEIINEEIERINNKNKIA